MGRTMDAGRLAAGLIWLASTAGAQDAELTILVDGALLEHGGVVEVTAVASPDAPIASQTIALIDRYAQVQFRYPEGASYSYHFQPAPDAMARQGMELFATEPLSVGTKTVDEPNGPQKSDWRSVRVFPFAEYGGSDIETRTSAAWGETQAFSDPPPANHWGARALMGIFDTSGNRRTVALICRDDHAVSICAPNAQDALLMEALWWRSIADGRLERLRYNGLQDCYDSGGLFHRPERCEAEPGRGWPTYRSAD